MISIPDGPQIESVDKLSTPAVVGICLGGALLLLSVAAVSCFCYRGHNVRNKKLRSAGGHYHHHLGSESQPFRKSTAVKHVCSPSSATGPAGHHLIMKKSPSPTSGGGKTPPGSCPIGGKAVILSGTTPTHESSSPQISRKNSLVSRCSPLLEEVQPPSNHHHHRETVIRFQLENEIVTAATTNKTDMIKMEDSAVAVAPNTAEQIFVKEVSVVASEAVAEGSNRLGQLYFKVRHNVEKSTLNITVVKCRGLPARDSNVGSSDPYVKLQLLPDKNHKVKTRVLRRTLNPVYDEDFTFYGIGENQLQSLTLHFVVLSFDRYSRDDVIGEVLLPITEALKESSDSSEVTLFRDIAPRSLKLKTHGRGELLVSLCYQPQASRLTAVILKARNIPRMDMTGLADPYVKLYLVHNGVRIAKKKTHVKKRTLNPVFNESFVFDLPAAATSLDNVSLEFVVLDWDRVTKNEVIGRLELGGSKSTGTALHHWNEVLNSPRRQIAEWHKLKD